MFGAITKMGNQRWDLSNCTDLDAALNNMPDASTGTISRHCQVLQLLEYTYQLNSMTKYDGPKTLVFVGEQDVHRLISELAFSGLFANRFFYDTKTKRYCLEFNAPHNEVSLNFAIFGVRRDFPTIIMVTEKDTTWRKDREIK